MPSFAAPGPHGPPAPCYRLLVWPVPPSANDCFVWRRIRRGQSWLTTLVRTDRYRRWLDGRLRDRRAAESCRPPKRLPPPPERPARGWSVTCVVGGKTAGGPAGDLDNRLKPLLDGCVHAGYLADDRDIAEAHIFRDRRLGAEWAIVELEPLP